MEQLNSDEIKVRIQKEIGKTEKIIEEYKEMTKPIAPENAIGRLSRMDAINNKAVIESALRQAEEKLSKLHTCLPKLVMKILAFAENAKAPSLWAEYY